jgi:hypothetical protein
VRMLLQTPEEEGADGSIGEPRAVDGCRNGPTPASPQPTHGFLLLSILPNTDCAEDVNRAQVLILNNLYRA